VVDELRRILQRAIELRVYVPRQFCFFNIRVTGRKKRRRGLVDLENVSVVRAL
jgi:hypothetical protein